MRMIRSGILTFLTVNLWAGRRQGGINIKVRKEVPVGLQETEIVTFTLQTILSLKTLTNQSFPKTPTETEKTENPNPSDFST